MSKVAFSALTETQATKLLSGFLVAAESNYQCMTLQGAWLGRRLVIVNASVSKSLVPDLPINPLALTLALPIDIDAITLARRCRSFGAVVERVWRDNDLGRFDRVVSGDDGARHQVHAFHHVALCGHKPSRWLLDGEVSVDVEVTSCATCASAAATKPVYGARYHPLAGTEPLR